MQISRDVSDIEMREMESSRDRPEEYVDLGLKAKKKDRIERLKCMCSREEAWEMADKQMKKCRIELNGQDK
jgi:biotin synthase-related radical SAM superfamily protein